MAAKVTKREHEGIWRSPNEETVGAYPGLAVHDGRVSGSITIGASRVPLWALTGALRVGGWEEIESDYGIGEILGGLGEDELWALIHHLFQMRGEFARLLCVLGDVERVEELVDDDRAWWDEPGQRRRVREALLNCLKALDEIDAAQDGEAS